MTLPVTERFPWPLGKSSVPKDSLSLYPGLSCSGQALSIYSRKTGDQVNSALTWSRGPNATPLIEDKDLRQSQ